ncbi:MAG: hypothetical protein ACTSRH_10000 [Promethearchaeota archaeon]
MKRSKYGTKIFIFSDKNVELEKVLQLPQILPSGEWRLSLVKKRS